MSTYCIVSFSRAYSVDPWPRFKPVQSIRCPQGTLGMREQFGLPCMVKLIFPFNLTK